MNGVMVNLNKYPMMSQIRFLECFYIESTFEILDARNAT